ncbi:energy transducer TonB [Undibacterium squillarum]|uniref:energy transducer TonB n=1 Tax=Undibacterium squillarum TaxID=1131567 RepID=UPI0035AE3F43
MMSPALSSGPSLSFHVNGAPASGKWISVGIILLAHVGLAMALLQGITVPASQPKEVVMTLIAPPAPPTPPKAQPELPKPKTTQTTTAPAVIAPAAAPVQPVVAAISASPEPAPRAEPVSSHQAAAPVAAPAAPVSAGPKVVSAVEYLRPPRPEYPAMARRMGEEGKVVMRVLVNDKGQAEKIDIQQSSGSQRLDDAARIAIQRALFKPYFEDGKALAMIATATINFAIDN